MDEKDGLREAGPGPRAGYFYLHDDGSLIFKPRSVVDSDPNYFDSPFVRKVWSVPDRYRGRAWVLVIEALALGAKESRIAELASKWGLTDEDAQEFARRADLRLWRDGAKWCAAFADFVNVQESQVGFGDDCLHALAELARPGLLEGGREVVDPRALG